MYSEVRLAWYLVCCDKHCDQKRLGRKGAIWLALAGPDLALRSWGRSSNSNGHRDHEGTMLTGLPTCLGKELLTVGWDFLHQLAIKKNQSDRFS